MRVIDAHTHLWGPRMTGDFWWDALIRFGVSVSGHSFEDVKKRIEGQSDETGDELVKDMDEAGVEKALVHIVDFSLFRGSSDNCSLEELHEICYKAVEKHKDRLLLVGGVDPRRPDAAKFVEKAVKDYKIVAVKMHPATGFYPNDRCCYHVYCKLQELGIPAWIHTGPEIAPLYSKYTQPVFLDEVANEFPDLTIIMAHGGLCWWEEAAVLTSEKPNMYMDTAYWQIKGLGRGPEWELYRQLRWVITMAGKKKVLYGTDWPATRLVKRANYTTWLERLKNPPPIVKQMGIEFTQEEMDLFLGGNTARLFNL